MRVDISTTDIPTAGSRVQINNIENRITLIIVQARPGNTGSIYIGMSDVSSTIGWELEPTDQQILDFDPQGKGASIAFSELYADTAGGGNGNDLDWMAIFKQ